MKRIFYAVLISVLVGMVWFGSIGRSGGQNKDGPALDERFCADANGDGKVDISDPIWILEHLFLGGREPPWCIAQGLPACAYCDDRYVNEGQPDAITPMMVQAGYYDRLDAGLLDGKDSTEFALANHTHSEFAELAALKDRIALLEAKLDSVSVVGNTVKFTGVNVQIVNGLGVTNGYPDDRQSVDPTKTVVNGFGNLIVGYNEDGNPNSKTGSHNVIVGRANLYTQFGGIVSGSSNEIRGPYACVTGGHRNNAAGQYSSISGGEGNTVTGDFSSISGGKGNSIALQTGPGDLRFGSYCSILGGSSNSVYGNYSTIAGGISNTDGGDYSAICGGGDNIINFNVPATVTKSVIRGGCGQRLNNGNCVFQP